MTIKSSRGKSVGWGAIYANATLTIVAVDGINADFGLRGCQDISKQRGWL
jgi:hypothetical protein